MQYAAVVFTIAHSRMQQIIYVTLSCTFTVLPSRGNLRQ